MEHNCKILVPLLTLTQASESVIGDIEGQMNKGEEL
jgi:hypothetical protein